MKIINFFFSRFLLVWRRQIIFIFCLLVALTCVAPTLASTQTVEWIRQPGTSSDDYSRGVSADGLGNVYISGQTAGSLGGPYLGGYSDAFISKYNASGSLLWSKQLGTSSADYSGNVSADALGNVFCVGSSYGSLGGPSAGGWDAFISKHDASSGALIWSKQFGTTNQDNGYGVSADGLGNVYISGYTYDSLDGENAGGSDVFLRKYDAAGTLQWSKQFGTSVTDYSLDVSADSLGNVYISGDTYGSMAGENAGDCDVFVSKYNALGALQWTRQLGTSATDKNHSVSADGLGNVYISGYTIGSFEGSNAGNYDAFVSKFNASGDLLWTEQLGTSSSDLCHGVSADGLGNVYITGFTEGSLEGSNAGGSDVFVSKYNASGTLLWTEQLGSAGWEDGCGISADGLGNVYFTGHTTGNLGGENAGCCDAFVGKICDVPEPSGVVGLLGLCLAGLIAAVRRRGLRL